MKVVVAHFGKQHSLQTALAFQEKGSLYAYITTVYSKEVSIMNFFRFLLNKKYKRKFASRKENRIPDNKVIQYYEIPVLFLLFLNKCNLNRLITDYINQFIQKKFAIKVANYVIKNKIDVVIMYDTNVFDAFEIIHRQSPNTICILDTTIANRSYIKEIYENDLRLYPNSGLKKEQSFLWHKESWIKRYVEEFRVADYCLVGSDFVKKSISHIVSDTSKILKIPYGVNLNMFQPVDRDYSVAPLHLLFVGGVIRRKGIHHLINVVKKYSSDKIILHIAGSYNDKDTIYLENKYCENIIFEGFVTRDIITILYQKCHVFVLPSLAEGMAMVGLEALASGLPIICTTNSGLDDVVKENVNGFIIPTSDEYALKEKIDYCLNNRDILQKMSNNARTSVYMYSWDNYRNNLYNVISNIFQK